MSERRKNGRVRLTCTVALWDPSEGTVIQTQTENISCEGFYCLSAEPFSPGTRLEAILEIPYRLRAGKRSERLALQCNVHVIRVDSTGPRPLFGVACQIDDYAVVPLCGWPAGELSVQQEVTDDPTFLYTFSRRAVSTWR